MSALPLLVVTSLCGLIYGQEQLPQVQTQGDVMPFLARAEVLGARSRTCLNGTEFIVTFSDDTLPEDAIGVMNDRLGQSASNKCRSLQHTDEGSSTKAPGQLNAMTMCVPDDQDVEAHLQVLLAMEGVEAVEENMPVNILAVPWHLDRIDQVSLPLDGRYMPSGTGRGVRVYVADTGTDATHPEFEGRVTAGYSAVNGQRATRDMGNHGTHVAGIIGSRTYGVAKDATIIPVKVFSDRGGGASSADIVEGINWVITHKRSYRASSILSMSLGMASSNFYAGNQALKRAVQSGIIPVVAAGNDHIDACRFWPAQSTSVITVGSTDRRDYRSSFSNYGSCVTVYAPGSDITSTLPGGRHGVMSGTSMACPVVSGIVALYLETHPTAKFDTIKAALVKNAVGQKNIVAARRMLLVQANQRAAWPLLESNQRAAPIYTTSTALWASFFGMGCIAALVAFITLRDDKISRTTSAQSAEMLEM